MARDSERKMVTIMASKIHVKDNLESCAQECIQCHSVTLETMNYCLGMAGDYNDPELLRLLRDCMEICQVNANFLIAGSFFHTKTCLIAAEICDATALACSQFEEDEQMKACQESCEQCANSCRRLSVSIAAA